MFNIYCYNNRKVCKYLIINKLVGQNKHHIGSRNVLFSTYLTPICCYFCTKINIQIIIRNINKV